MDIWQKLAELAETGEEHPQGRALKFWHYGEATVIGIADLRFGSNAAWLPRDTALISYRWWQLCRLLNEARAGNVDYTYGVCLDFAGAHPDLSVWINGEQIKQAR